MMSEQNEGISIPAPLIHEAARAIRFLDQVREQGDNGTGAYRDALDWVESTLRNIARYHRD